MLRIDRELTLQFFRPLNRTGARLPILMYHSVSDDQETGVAPYYRVTTHPRRFSEQMRWLAELGYTGVSLEDALAAGPSSHATKMVAITFDDGFRDFHTSAFPVLERHGFTATMYLPTTFISVRRRSWLGRECLTWSEIRDLRKQGVRFGSHTENHRDLYRMTWREIQQELTLSKDRIEQEIGETVTSFAYPFAFPQEDRTYTRRFIETVRTRGYETCATTIIGRWQPGDDLFALKRLPVNDCDDRKLFAAKLAGAYDWMAHPQRVVRHAKAWMGRTRRRSERSGN